MIFHEFENQFAWRKYSSFAAFYIELKVSFKKRHIKETDEGPQKVECEQPVGYCTLLYILRTDNVDFNTMQIKNFSEVKERGIFCL